MSLAESKESNPTYIGIANSCLDLITITGFSENSVRTELLRLVNSHNGWHVFRGERACITPSDIHIGKITDTID